MLGTEYKNSKLVPNFFLTRRKVVEIWGKYAKCQAKAHKICEKSKNQDKSLNRAKKLHKIGSKSREIDTRNAQNTTKNTSIFRNSVL